MSECSVENCQFRNKSDGEKPVVIDPNMKQETGDRKPAQLEAVTVESAGEQQIMNAVANEPTVEIMIDNQEAAMCRLRGEIDG